MNEVYHIPVLLSESIDGLDIKPQGVYVDVTFGGGGHSREILRRLKEADKTADKRDGEAHLYSFDQDEDAERNIYGNGTDEDSMESKGVSSRFTFVRSNFRYLKNWMRYYGVEQIDGLLADLGVSSHHLDDEQRGFSFRFDAPLDMRMNKRAGMTAADIVNTYDEKQLADVFYLYGELRNSRQLASAIARTRAKEKIITTQNLLDVVSPMLKREREKKEMAKVFQALRIEVNHEMQALGEMLTSAIELLKPGGRLSIITYHSLEDRIVKNVIRAGNIEGKQESDFYGRINSPLKAINSKPILPTAEEQQNNPRSRSAKLRIAEKL